MSRNIQAALQSVADAAISELDKILAKLEEIRTATADLVTNVTAPPPAGGGSPEEPVEPGQGANALDPGTNRSHIDLRGAVIFGYDESARRVAEAQAQNARRSGSLVPA